VKNLAKSFYPTDFCSYVATESAQQIAIPDLPFDIGKLQAFVKELIANVTYCVECNLCENAVIFAEMEILPNPNLPKCLLNFVNGTVCPQLNLPALPAGFPNLADMCEKFTPLYLNDAIGSLKVYTNANFLCRSVTQLCANPFGTNILECVCDNVKLPKAVSWLMAPCRRYHPNP